jgi:hypothetical protein
MSVAAWGLVRDEPVAVKDPPDRRDRGDLLQAACEVIGDGPRAGIVARRGELAGAP